MEYSIDKTAALPAPRFGPQDSGLLVVLAAAVSVSLTHLRGRRWLRRSLQLVVIGYVGLLTGQLLSQSLLVGWNATHVAWRTAPGLVLLAVVSFALPPVTRRNVYCLHGCPHGASQELIGSLCPRRWRVPVPADIDRGLRWLPPILLVLVLVICMQGLPIDLANFEPFDAYLLSAVGWIPVLLAVLGLFAAFFVPRAYCKFGCPTGSLIELTRSHGPAERIGRREAIVGVLFVLALVLSLAHDVICAWLLGV